ncbi:ABC transporter [Novacetimonas cocois]|uniref:ABC transporter n=2 Tax=Novacetimonas cocois TaxID=1747507 RepID=A0A365YRK6_9PROT|nr:ABC transporter [Novacetimonas cocois]
MGMAPDVDGGARRPAVAGDPLGGAPAMTGPDATSGTTCAAGRAGPIRLHDIAAGYGRAAVWRHVSGSFAPGSLTAIAGANGAGKSTLVRALLGEVPLREGHIDYGGQRPRDFGYLPQARDIDRGFPMCVADLVLSGAWRVTGAFGAVDVALRERAARCLKHVRLSGMEERAIGDLSAGQFQRLLFARLLMQDARVIILDEPFTALDAPTTRDLLHLVDHWRDEGRTVIAVLHDLRQITQHFPSVVLLARGAAHWGPTRDILTPPLLEQAYGANAMFACPMGPDDGARPDGAAADAWS